MNTHADPPPPSPAPRLPLRSERAPDAPHVVREWLASAHEVPARAQAEWSDQGVALLPLGRRFAAVRVPGVLVHTAAGTDMPEQVADMLCAVLDGPVIHDHLSAGPVYYALAAYGRGTSWWGADDTPLLTTGSYLGVPVLHRIAPPGTYWMIPPRYRNDLCSREAVFGLIVKGRRQLRAVTPRPGGA